VKPAELRLVKPSYALAADLVAVIVFAVVGRSSHGEGIGLADVAATAWPFLVGCLAGWAVLRLRRDPGHPLLGGALAAVTVGIGMVLRVVTGGSTHWSFILVALLFLGLVLTGWRVLARVIRR